MSSYLGVCPEKRAFVALTLASTFLAAVTSAAAQDPSDVIYSESTVGTFTLTLSAPDWIAICNDGTGAGDLWKRGTMTWTNGTITETVAGVGIKRSGKYSAGIDTPKPGIRISFNEFEFEPQRRKWRGVNRIKLDSMIGNTDMTMMRDRVAYWTFGQAGAPASRACHARLVVNGDYKGVYTVEEPVKEPFAMYRWGEHDGNMYDVEWGADRPYLWVGNNSASYIPSKFIAETNYPGGDYSDIVRLIDIVNNNQPNQIASLLNGHININTFYSHIAAQIMIADADGIAHWSGGGHCNNHSWYHRAGTNRMELIKWDPGASQGMYDSNSFGNFPKGESPMFYRFDGVPLVRWLVTDATGNAAVKARVSSLVNGPYASNVLAKIDSIYNQIRTAVYQDPYKGISPNQGSPAPLPNGFTNAEFDAARNWLKDWYVKRIAYLRTQVGGTTPQPPTAPTGLTATATSSSQINLSWTDASNNETGFEIDRAAAAGGPWTQIATVGANVTTYSNTGLTASTTYYYRVRATNSAGDSPNSNVANATTPGNLPSAPSGLTATAASTTQINLAWTDNSGSETGYEIDRAAAATGPWTQIATAPANSTTFSNTGLTASTTYHYRVRATNANGDSANSNVASATTNAPPAVAPTAPSGLTATASSSTQINLSWTDTSGNETEFEIDRAAAATGPWTQIATVPANVTTYSNTGLTASTTYFYRVRATNTAGDSANSNVASATTNAPPTVAPTAPSGLTATATSPTQINLSWTDASNDETEFEIDQATAAGGPWIQIATVGANVTTYSNTGLTAATQYFYRVRATNTAGDSANSNVANATTLGTGAGLSATYYDNSDFAGTSVTRTDARIDFDWVGGSPAPGIAPDTFSIRWTGRLRAQYSETYTLYTFTNDGVRLWVEGEPLVDRWVQQSGGIEWSAQMPLQAGRWYTIQMDYYENLGNALARLSWSSPSTPKQVIPQTALDPALGAPDSRDNDGDGTPNDSDLDDDNDGIADLQDPDRDGDTLANLAEIASGSDPDNRNSPNAGGIPPVVADGDNPNGHGPFLINDKCGGSIPAGETGGLIAVGLILALLTFGDSRKRR